MQVRSGWLRLERGDYGLDKWTLGESVYALAWTTKKKELQGDKWAMGIHDFKDNPQWVDYRFSRTLQEKLPPLISALGLRGQTIHVATALPSDSTKSSRYDPLHGLAKGLCASLKDLKLKFQPDLLTKEVHQSLKYMRDGDAMDAEIRGKYECECLRESNPVILVLDDLVTQGSTFSEIRRAITEANKGARVVPIALGKHVFPDVFQEIIGSANGNDERLGPW